MDDFFSRLVRLPLGILLLANLLFAQNNRPDAAAGAAGCALCSTFLFIPVGIFILNILLLIWVAKDSKARGMDNSIVWMLLVMFTSVVGLLIYLGARPAGLLVKCENCKNNRLQALSKCPHCGTA